MAEQRRGGRYQWSGKCRCGGWIKVATDSPEGLQEIAETWRRQHPDCAPKEGD